MSEGYLGERGYKYVHIIFLGVLVCALLVFKEQKI